VSYVDPTTGSLREYPLDNLELWPWKLADTPELPSDAWRLIAMYADIPSILNLGRVNKQLRAMFRDETREPWVSLRKQLEKILPPSVMPLAEESIRTFYSGTILRMKRSSFTKYSVRDFTIVLALFFPFAHEADTTIYFVGAGGYGKIQCDDTTYFLGRLPKARSLTLKGSLGGAILTLKRRTVEHFLYTFLHSCRPKDNMQQVLINAAYFKKWAVFQAEVDELK
jgi:hypothetical protein